MAELPQIKKMRRKVVGRVVNKKMTGFEVFNERILKGDKSLFQRKIVGSSFRYIRVMGRILIIKINSGYFLFVNLYSNGEFVLSEPSTTFFDKSKKVVLGESPPKYVRAVFEFKGGLKLYFTDKRANVTFEILNAKQRKRRLVYFGTDPLGKKFTFLKFKQILRNKRAALRNFLKNQKYIYGIGDEYVNKICIEARVNQEKGIRELRQAEIKRLYRAIRRVLKRGLKRP